MKLKEVPDGVEFRPNHMPTWICRCLWIRIAHRNYVCIDGRYNLCYSGLHSALREPEKWANHELEETLEVEADLLASALAMRFNDQ